MFRAVADATPPPVSVKLGDIHDGRCVRAQKKYAIAISLALWTRLNAQHQAAACQVPIPTTLAITRAWSVPIVVCLSAGTLNCCICRCPPFKFV